MFKNKKDTLKTIATIIIFGVVGLTISVILTLMMPYVGAIPIVTFSILYLIIVINFILANGVVENVKSYFSERFCKNFNETHPKSGKVYDELSFERAKLNEMVNEYNKLPYKTNEEIKFKDNKFASLNEQKTKYNNLFKSLSGLSKNDVSAFNKFNKLNNVFLPIIIRKHEANENVVLKSSENQLKNDRVKTQNKTKQKESASEQQQNGVIEPISQDIMSQLKDNAAPNLTAQRQSFKTMQSQQHQNKAKTKTNSTKKTQQKR